MKTMITGLIIGTIAGILLALLLIFYTSPSLMLKENKSKYDFERTVAEFEKSVEAAGWKLPHVNDLQATLNNFGMKVRQVKVFEICHPEHAFKVLSQDDERIVSSLMPCRVAVYEKSNGKVYLSRMNAGLLSKPMNKVIKETMSEAASDTEKILQGLID